MLVIQFGIEQATGAIQIGSRTNISGVQLVALGLGYLSGVVLILEFASHPLKDASKSADSNGPNQHKFELPTKCAAREYTLRPGFITLLELLIIQLIIILLYAGFLDGGIRFRGCPFSYLCYLVGVAMVFARRGLALTKGDLIWIKWAWLPFITFGVPLYVSVLKGKWPIDYFRWLDFG
jgi:hypothetical protein